MARRRIQYRLSFLFVFISVIASALVPIHRYIARQRAWHELERVFQRIDYSNANAVARGQHILHEFPELSARKGVTLWTARFADWETLDLVLKSGGHADEGGGWNGGCPLYFAIRRRDVRLVECLLRHGANPFAHTNIQGASPSMFCHACQWGPLESVQLLMAAGFDVNVHREDPTPLHYAVANGDLEIVRFLLCCGADPCARNGLGLTPEEHVSLCINIAAANGDEEGEIELRRVREELRKWDWAEKSANCHFE